MNETYRDNELSLQENVTKLVLESKLKNLPFGILKAGVQHGYPEENFNNYKKHVGDQESRVAIKQEDLSFFPGWNEIQKELTKIYGNPTNVYNSLMQTNEYSINKVHASLHCDPSDVIHLCCYGSVDWLLIDPEDKAEYRITLEPGDFLYMRGYVLHETTPLSNRGSLIFMNLSYEEFPDQITGSFKNEKEREAFYKKQREDFLLTLNKSSYIY
jgi:hypothetical protein